jgi:hypothetical protein
VFGPAEEGPGPTEAAIHLDSLLGLALLFDEVRRAVGLEFAGCLASRALLFATVLDVAFVVEAAAISESAISVAIAVSTESSSESEVALEYSFTTCVLFICNITASFLPLKMLQIGHFIITEDGADEGLAFDASPSWWLSRELGEKGSGFVLCSSVDIDGIVSTGTFGFPHSTNA